jgi:hypothetical protein
MNINPNHVNIEKGGWELILSFKTIKKNVPVEIYARPMKMPNSGEFVMVRKGLLPFGMNSISEIFRNEKHVWQKNLIDCETYTISGNYGSTNQSNRYTHICMIIGDFKKESKYSSLPSPSISFCLWKACSDTIFSFDGMNYINLDTILFFNKFWDRNFGSYSDYQEHKELIISPQIEKIFPKPLEGILETTKITNKQKSK